MSSHKIIIQNFSTEVSKKFVQKNLYKNEVAVLKVPGFLNAGAVLVDCFAAGSCFLLVLENVYLKISIF